MTISFGNSKKPFLAAIILLSILVLALIIAVVILAVHEKENTPTKEMYTENYCYKSHCLIAASEIMESINTSVNPCDDFYEHSCGAWIKSHRISPDQGSVGTFSNVRHTVSNRLIDLFQENPSKDEPLAIWKAKSFFRSCMDLNSIEEKSKSIIIESIEQMKDAPSYVDLVNLLIGARANVLVPAYVSADSKNVSRNIITISVIPLILQVKKYYNKSSEVFNALEDLIDGFSDVTNNSTQSIIDFEWKLQEIYPELNDNSSETYNLMTIGDLHNMTLDQVKWLEIFNRAINMSGSDVQVDDKTEILVLYPKYIKQLADILNTTDLITLINYAITRYMIQNIDAMPVKYRNLYQQLHKKMYHTNAPPSRGKVCADYVNALMPQATGRIYVDNFFPKSSKTQAKELVMSLRNALEKMFQETDWMDEKTRMAAIDKVESVLPFIGYDDSLKNNTILNLYFEGLNFTENNFMGNVIKINHEYGKNSFFGLEILNTRAKWGSISSATVNAFYNPSQNAIFFPAGILQAPFYDAQYPLSMLFGAMGAVVGHEFTHGFDNLGAQYDKVGNLKNWWTAESLKNFKARAAGLKTQYAKFPICKDIGCKLQINENKTIGENIADNGGVKAAFNAYKKYIENHKIKSKLLPGLSYTSDQLFFVGYAHIWCRKIQPIALVHQLLTDVHSPANARVIVTLRNSEAFSTAFKCKKNSGMNPAIKYGVW